DLGCNPTPPTCAQVQTLGITASDNCSGSITPNCSAGAVVSDGCKRSLTFTLTATDSYNKSSTCQVTYNWTEDKTPPVILASATTLTPGCNASAADIEAALGSATYTDNCGALTPTALAGVDGSVSTSGCSRSQTRTWNVSDVCGNAAITVSRTVTWTEDTTKPVIVASGTTLTLGCNPSETGRQSGRGRACYSDNCGALT